MLMRALLAIVSLAMLQAVAAAQSEVPVGIDDSSLYDKEAAPIARETGEYRCSAEGAVLRIEIAWRSGTSVELIDFSIDGGAVKALPEIDLKALFGRFSSIEQKGLICRDGRPLSFAFIGRTNSTESGPRQAPSPKLAYFLSLDPNARLVTSITEYKDP